MLCYIQGPGPVLHAARGSGELFKNFSGGSECETAPEVKLLGEVCNLHLVLLLLPRCFNCEVLHSFKTSFSPFKLLFCTLIIFCTMLHHYYNCLTA